MLFSYQWLLRLCSVRESVERVAEALTSRGLTVDAVEAAGEDHVLDVDVPANRPDCLGHLGMARELSAAFDAELSSPPAVEADRVAGRAEWAHVAIEAPDLCARYTASRVTDVRIGPSPPWVVERLEACGLRSINNAVDASNLVLLELGHPIHFFDAARLRGLGDEARPAVVVRRARPRESLETLDGQKRELTEEMLVIADGAGPTALAGVIGGADSEIRDSTRDVLIEAAHFEPKSIRRTARRLSAHTDASFRFERGVDPDTALAAQAMAARLLVELAGGRVEPSVIDVYPGRSAPSKLTMRTERVRRLLGYQPATEAVVGALRALRLSPEATGDGRVEVSVPSWRVDLEREADVVEEVARHVGYDAIPSAAASFEPPRAADACLSVSERWGDVLAQQGFHEAVGYAMIAEDEDGPWVDEKAREALRLENPIAEPMARLRRSILPGLLRALDLNQRRGNRDVRLFECGRVFLPRTGETLPFEPVHLAFVWSGRARPGHWGDADRDVDVFDAVGLVERLLGSSGVETGDRSGEACRRGLHPGAAFCWRTADGDELAWGGGLHPNLQASLEHAAFVAEIDLDAVLRRPAATALHRAVPRVPAVTRDLAVVMTPDHSYRRLVEELKRVPSPAPVRFEATDRYQGQPLGEGESSLTLRVTLHPETRTLTDAETEAYREALVHRLREGLGLRLRG